MIIKIMWFMMPAFFATMMPVFVRKSNFLNAPINKTIFGKNKTYRGFFFGIITSIIIIFLQMLLYQYPFFQGLSLIDYSTSNFILIGFLMGFGALFGDLIKSFFKRRFNIKSGKSWVPFDQIDYVIGTILFTFWLLDFEKIIYMISIGGTLHYLAVKFAFFIRIRT